MEASWLDRMPPRPPRTWLADGSGGSALLGISVSMTITALLTCVLRFFVQWRVKRRMGWDDYMIVLAMIMAFVAMVFTSIESQSLRDPIRAMMYNFLAQPWLTFASTLAQISICFFFLRVIGRVQPWTSLLTGLIVILAVVNLTFALLSNLRCRPLEKVWDPSVEGTCFEHVIELNLGYFQGGFSVFTYYFLAVFPVMIVKDQDFAKRVRWPFYALSVSSFLAGTLAIVRTQQTSLINTDRGYVYANLTANMMALMIQNLGIAAANTLTFGPLLSWRWRRRTPHSAWSQDDLAERQFSQDFSSPSSSPDTMLKHNSFLIIQGGKTTPEFGPGPIGQQPTKPAAAAVNPGPGANRRLSTDSEMEALQQHFGMPWPGQPFGGILKTVSVQIVEEDRAEVEKRYQGRRITRGTSWQAILRGISP